MADRPVIRGKVALPRATMSWRWALSLPEALVCPTQHWSLQKVPAQLCNIVASTTRRCHCGRNVNVPVGGMPPGNGPFAQHEQREWRVSLHSGRHSCAQRYSEQLLLISSPRSCLVPKAAAHLTDRARVELWQRHGAGCRPYHIAIPHAAHDRQLP